MSLKLNNIRVKKSSGVKPSELSILKQISQKGQDSENGLFITSIFPSQLTIELDTLYSRSTIQRAYEAWEERGVLLFVKYRSRGTKEYKIDLVKLNEYLDVLANILPKVSKLSSVINSAASVGNSAASSRNTDPFSDPFFKKGFNKNKEARSPSFIPIEQVREDSKANMDFKPTLEQKMLAKRAIGEMLKNTRGY